jgi:hypothetical protein
MRRDPRKIALLAIVLVIAIAAGVIVAGGLSGDAAPSAGGSGAVSAEALDTAVSGLCQMRLALDQGDIQEARTIFYDKAHLFLHQLAAAVEVKDRDRATSLLIAKYRVEDLVPPSGQLPATAAGDTAPSLLVSQLLQEVGPSAKILGLSAPDCQ